MARYRIHALVLAIFATALWVKPLVPQAAVAPQTISRPAFGAPVNNGYPSLARSASGDLWLAWISRRTADVQHRGSAGDLVASDHIMLQRRRGSE